MLKTKPVRYLQSRPHHIKVTIFVVTMLTAGVISISLLANSLSNNFIAADIKKVKEESGAVDVATASDASSPSIFENLKASIGDFGSAVGSIFSSSAENDVGISVRKNDSAKKDKDIDAVNEIHHSIDYQKIVPAQLPVDKQ